MCSLCENFKKPSLIHYILFCYARNMPYIGRHLKFYEKNADSKKSGNYKCKECGSLYSEKEFVIRVKERISLTLCFCFVFVINRLLLFGDLRNYYIALGCHEPFQLMPVWLFIMSLPGLFLGYYICYLVFFLPVVLFISYPFTKFYPDEE